MHVTFARILVVSWADDMGEVFQAWEKRMQSRRARKPWGWTGGDHSLIFSNIMKYSADWRLREKATEVGSAQISVGSVQLAKNITFLYSEGV